MSAGVEVCGVCGVRYLDGATNGSAEAAPAQVQAATPAVTEPVPAYPTATPPVTPMAQPAPVAPTVIPPMAAAPVAPAVVPAAVPAVVPAVVPAMAPVAEPAAKAIRLKGGHLAALSAVVALILFGSIAAGAMTAPKPKPAGDLVGSLPFGPEGGTQAFDNGAGKIKVPKGALDGQKTIEIRRTIVRERVTAQSPTGVPLIFPPGALIAYTFGPITLVFNRPITITLRLPPGQGGLVFVTANGQIQFFPGTVNGQTITIRLNSLDLQRPGAIVAV